jgi:Na+/H+-dicarboxylate symporter
MKSIYVKITIGFILGGIAGYFIYPAIQKKKTA